MLGAPLLCTTRGYLDKGKYGLASCSLVVLEEVRLILHTAHGTHSDTAHGTQHTAHTVTR